MSAPAILWFRNDLRLKDQAALIAAAASGPVLPVYILDEESPGVRPPGGASRWWLHHSLKALDSALGARGGRLLLLRGQSAPMLERLAATTGASAIHAIRQPEPWWPAIESGIQRLALHEGSSLVPPGILRTKTGGRFRVFTPYWRQHQAHGAPPLPRPAPASLAFAAWPDDAALAGARLEDWGLLPVKPDWATGFSIHQPGEDGAQAALETFLPRLPAYDERRDFPSEPATSCLSAHLHFGEVSAATAWHAAVSDSPEAATPWVRQLVWRDFAHETLAQFPESATRPHRPEYDRMPWTDLSTQAGKALFCAWREGRTGYPLVDAGMRQLWATGWMHNRVRMVAGSFLVKHLMIDWREGERWFWDTLVDADLANNAMGWQWVMGSGVDSSPYYRIFAPLGQSSKFDAGDYIRRWVPELSALKGDAVHGPFPRGWKGYPPPIVDHGEARARALAAHAGLKG
ncbi:cryptochrome/photolyase family protein [Sandaracinobacteroides sp. A072]|uniref:cryptochrome/photolyase family protein n=1 Tax=Sandaracinobacteroides sp. A072 TaxID=3461146 RepID=UPI0040415201